MGYQAPEPPSIGDALISVRAAIDLVSSGSARRVTLELAAPDRILPAARALARAAGLTFGESWRGDSGYQIAISREPEPLSRRDPNRLDRGAPRVAS